MPPRLNIWSACRSLSLAVRTRAAVKAPQMSGPVALLSRGLADNISSRQPPFFPQNKSPQGIPPYSPSQGQPQPQPQPAIQAQTEPETETYTSPENERAINQLRMIEYGLDPLDPAVEGHKFGLPDLPLPPEKTQKHRYDDVLQLVTRLMMKDGKLAKAQRDVAMVLNYLRTSPPPKIDPSKPLIPGHPPAQHLPLDPITYMTVAIDSVAPLIRMRGFKGLAGGGRSLEVPVPLKARQRRRTAINWILEVARKKPNRGSGRGTWPHRVAEEIIAVVEGRSPVWDKRTAIHKVGTANRSNLNHAQVKGRI